MGWRRPHDWRERTWSVGSVRVVRSSAESGAEGRLCGCVLLASDAGGQRCSTLESTDEAEGAEGASWLKRTPYLLGACSLPRDAGGGSPFAAHDLPGWTDAAGGLNPSWLPGDVKLPQRMYVRCYKIFAQSGCSV